MVFSLSLCTLLALASTASSAELKLDVATGGAYTISYGDGITLNGAAIMVGVGDY